MKYSTLRLRLFVMAILLAATTTGQTVYHDQPYRQNYSVKYEILPVAESSGSAGTVGSVGTSGISDLRLYKVLADRNGVVQVLSSEGLLRPSGGAFLYPGELTVDRTYRPMLDMSIRAIGLYNEQFVYLSDKAVLSNAWAGKLYDVHSLPTPTIFAGGPDFQFLVSDGKNLQLLAGATVLWTGKSDDSLKDMAYDKTAGLYWLLGAHSVAAFSPADKSLKIIYKTGGFPHGISNGSAGASGTGELTCFASGNKQELLIGTHAGYFKLNTTSGLASPVIDRLPCRDLTVIRTIAGQTWFGSVGGAFMLRPDGKYDYYASKRWLPSDRVLDIAAGKDGTLLILSDKGLGEIHFDPMTLQDKALFFENQVRARHIRLGFNATLAGMKNGDIDSGSLEDSDNDGLWTSMYLGAEVFRYAATHSPDALQNCRESLDAMERLFTVNSLKGFPSRSFERHGYELADTQVWRKAAVPQWDWKSTTSSDEAIGHIFVYGVIAELIDVPDIRSKAIRLMDTLMSHIVEHDMYLIDWNGKPTTWGRWNPEYVNARPVMVGDRKINSSNIIGMLQTAWHFTGKTKYRDKAFELMYKYGYLENLMRPMKEIGHAPADADDLSKRLSENWNHSDDEMYFLGYWGLYRYAFNDSLKEQYRASILDHWKAVKPEKEGTWDLFTAMTGTKDFDLDAAIWYLKRYPLDLIEWRVNNSARKDIDSIPDNFMGQYTTEVLPPDELFISRHNSNRFDLDGGNGGRSESSAGDIWLLPYWLGRYLKVITPPEGVGTIVPQRKDHARIGPGLQTQLKH